MKNEKEEQLKQKAQKISIAEGSGYSIMDGFGLRYIIPFAVALGATNFIIGLLSSLPHLLGSFSQLFSIKAMEKYTRKKIVLLSVFLQATLWLPIIFVGIGYLIFNLNSFIASISLLVFYTLMTLAGSLAGPSWNSWMRDIVPENSGSYFGRRSAITGAVALISMLLAGLLLDYSRESGKIIIGFITLFAIACLGRFLSGILFTKQYEPKFKYDKSKYFSLTDFVERIFKNNFGHFVLFTGIMIFATAIASPFFSVYMLKDLGFEKNYIFYTIIAMAPVVSALAVTKLWGRFIDKYGNIKTMRLTGVFVSLIPLLWLLSYFIKDFLGRKMIIYLLIAEGFSGIIWAGFNLAAAVFVYRAVTKERMAICVAYSGIINAILLFLGAILGGYLATKGLFGIHPLLMVFALSGILRFVASIMIIKFIKEVRPVKQLKFQDIRLFLHRLSPLHLFNLGIKRIGLPIGIHSE